MKIVTIIGARPQFIKAAVVSRAISSFPDVQEVIVHTGQHFDTNMSDIFFEEMCIPKPNYNLNINGMTHGAMTGQMLEKIESILLAEQPNWVIVYGDTNSTLAGALAASKLHIRVAHIEAGLRSYNMNMPEEINRILTDRISSVLFCPTEQAIKNLYQEGFKQSPCTLLNCGDVMQDAALFYANKAKCPDFSLPEHFILATLHRAENTDSPERLQSIIAALEEIAREMPVVIPIHPRTRKKLQELNFDFKQTRLQLVDPVGYLEMVHLLKHCSLVATDSGGLQKEAYFFKKYCITLRTETEWVELVEQGANIITGWRYEDILNNYKQLKHTTKDVFSSPLYGDGEAGHIIIRELQRIDS